MLPVNRPSARSQGPAPSPPARPRTRPRWAGGCQRVSTARTRASDASWRTFVLRPGRGRTSRRASHCSSHFAVEILPAAGSRYPPLSLATWMPPGTARPPASGERLGAGLAVRSLPPRPVRDLLSRTLRSTHALRGLPFFFFFFFFVLGRFHRVHDLEVRLFVLVLFAGGLGLWHGSTPGESGGSGRPRGLPLLAGPCRAA